jgi:hypothetical protein
VHLWHYLPLALCMCARCINKPADVRVLTVRLCLCANRAVARRGPAVTGVTAS